MKVDWNDVKEDFKRKNEELEVLKQQLATAIQKARAYRISLENLEASLPKVRADAVNLLINEEMVVGRLRNDSMRSFIFVSDAKAFANQLEQGNE